MSSETSTRPWHFYIAMSLAAATVAVAMSRATHPAALLLLSAAVVSAGLVAWAVHNAVTALAGRSVTEDLAIRESDLEVLEREKMLTLRSLKELEFDRSMRKISDEDFAEIGARLRAQAMTLMEEIDRTTAALSHSRGTATGTTAVACAACGATRDADAKFCKACGARL